jgi:hypothetical protein
VDDVESGYSGGRSGQQRKNVHLQAAGARGPAGEDDKEPHCGFRSGIGRRVRNIGRPRHISLIRQNQPSNFTFGSSTAATHPTAPSVIDPRKYLGGSHSQFPMFIQTYAILFNFLNNSFQYLTLFL